MKIEIFPLDRVVIDGVSVYFGMKKSAVEALIGSGQAIKARHYYFNDEMAIDYHEDKVDFIEFLGGVDGKLKPIIYGTSAFDINAAELVEMLKAKNSGEICDTENGYSYQFASISVGVYREAIPEDVTDLIEESTRLGDPLSNDEIQNEMKRADHWATIGCGGTCYFQR